MSMLLITIGSLLYITIAFFFLMLGATLDYNGWKAWYIYPCALFWPFVLLYANLRR